MEECCADAKKCGQPSCECGAEIEYCKKDIRNILKDFIVEIESNDWNLYQPTINYCLLSKLLPSCIIRPSYKQITSIRFGQPLQLVEEEYCALETILSITDKTLSCMALQITHDDRTVDCYNVYILYCDLLKLTRTKLNKHDYVMDPKKIYEHSDKDTINIVNAYDILYDSDTIMEIG